MTGSFFTLGPPGLMSDTPSPPRPVEEVALNVALGPNSFDIVSNAPAACTAALARRLLLDEDLALDNEDVVDKRSGDVIRCNPGANWVGVDEG